MTTHYQDDQVTPPTRPGRTGTHLPRRLVPQIHTLLALATRVTTCPNNGGVA